jgi:hypothetical protein
MKDIARGRKCVLVKCYKRADQGRVHNDGGDDDGSTTEDLYRRESVLKMFPN